MSFRAERSPNGLRGQILPRRALTDFGFVDFSLPITYVTMLFLPVNGCISIEFPIPHLLLKSCQSEPLTSEAVSPLVKTTPEVSSLFSCDAFLPYRSRIAPCLMNSVVAILLWCGQMGHPVYRSSIAVPRGTAILLQFLGFRHSDSLSHPLHTSRHIYIEY